MGDKQEIKVCVRNIKGIENIIDNKINKPK